MKAFWSKFLESGIILALLTGIAYYLTYLYLDGSLAAYALPDELVEIDAPDIISTLIQLMYRFWGVLMIPAFGLMLGRLIQDVELTRLWRFSIVMVSAVVFAVQLVQRFEQTNWILLGIMVFEWLEALLKTLAHGRGRKGLRAKWKGYWEQRSPAGQVNERVALSIGYLAVTIAVMYVLSGAVMEHAAIARLQRESFFIARDYENQVVVFENSKCYVLMAREGNQLTNAYQVVRYDHIGRLDYVHTGVLTTPEKYPIVQ
ncbi:MAG: hypothetical protein GX418_10395 [Clostridiales bacterium]|nr:hypothetical protein [Clostridiales bacterium]